MQYNAISARRAVVTAIEANGAATRDEFDIDSIVDEIHQRYGTWDVEGVEPNEFWKIAKGWWRS
jgi:hypothetical protein